ncbi:hypothetical protein, partial [Pseudomonas sp. 008]|uniref:hypothetical protein n=1 Tax=Pseudomonas sp. 008 TaxID=2803906 RepID=UPI001EF211E0
AKILLHAGLGGLLAEAMGGDFRTGALAGGANEVLVGLLGDKLLPSNLVPGSAEYNQAQANILALSQIVGVLGAAASGGDVGVGAAVAANATQYNFLNHRDVEDLAAAEKACRLKGNCEAVKKEFDARSDANRERLKNCQATRNCAQIRAEIDEGARELGSLIERTEVLNPGGSDSDLAYYYQTQRNAVDWTVAGLNHLDQIGNLWVNNDGAWLKEAAVYLDQTGFNPFGINVIPGMYPSGETGSVKLKPIGETSPVGGGKGQPGSTTPEWDNAISKADGDFGYLNQPEPSRPPAFFDAKVYASEFMSNGRIKAADLEKLIPPGIADSFKSSATISEGSKYQYVWGGQKIEIKWHSPDTNAAAKFPESNSGAGWTAQIKIGNKLLGQDGKLYRKPSNLTHIPVDF